MADPKMMFEGLAVALVTPYRNGLVDRDALARITNHVIEGGTRALYPCGCTGEATSLTREEREQVIRTVIEAARGRASVIPGTGTAVTSETIELSQEAIRFGADGVMVITPYSCRPTQEGLLAHYRAVADRIDRPMVLYNVPSRTGVSLAPETIAKLAEHPRIAAIKEASGSLDQASAIRARSGIAILAGDDALYLPLLAVGARGVVSVAGHLVPREMDAIHAHVSAGRFAEAETIHRKLTPLFRALFLETNPAPVKHALMRLGMMAGELRLPLVPVRPETAAIIEQTLERIGVVAPVRSGG
jgi:4-hydroxy-tetrahydrodipicolinate synthase